jgi:hypothetical protein
LSGLPKYSKAWAFAEIAMFSSCKMVIPFCWKLHYELKWQWSIFLKQQ